MDLNLLCRGCLAETDALEHFKLDEIGLNDRSYKQMLEDVSGYPVLADQEPHRLCENCGIVLLEMYKFRQTLQETQDILEQLTKSMIVHEVVDVGDTEQIIEDDGYAIQVESLQPAKTIEELMADDDFQTFDTSLTYVKTENKMEVEQDGEDGTVYAIFEQSKIACPYCSVLCATNQTLSRHMKNQHPSLNADYNCQYCDKVFYFKEWLDNHERQCPGAKAERDGMTEFDCRYCGKVFNTYRNMRAHVVSCHQEEVKQEKFNHDGSVNGIDCPFCDVRLKNMSTLKHHLTNVHPEQRTLKCVFCDVYSFTQELLQSHQFKCKGYQEHMEQEELVCPYCPVTKIGKKKLNAHVVACHTRHTNTVPFECDICKKLLKTKSSLHSHMKIMHLEKQMLKCDFCGEHYKSISGLKYHISQYHSQTDTFSCHLCDFETKQEFLLRRHLKRHMGEKNHVCPECGRAFGSLDSLKNHMLVHTDERPWGCQYCSRTYKSKQKLRQHQRIHEGFRYECPVCTNTFVTNQALRQHVTKNHPEYDLPPPGTVMCETKSMLPRRIIQLEKRNDTLQ